LQTEDIERRLDELERRLVEIAQELGEVRAVVRAPRAAPPVALEPEPQPQPQPPTPPTPPPGPPTPAPLEEPVSVEEWKPPWQVARPPRRSLEQLAKDWDLVGPRGFAIAGGAVMALGIGFFFVLAANRGWIDARARVALGAGASVLALTAGVLLRSRYGQYWSALAAVGAGIAGAYASLAAATVRYDLVPSELALPLAGLIAAVGTAVAIRWRSQLIAALGLGGAALAPALQAIDTGMSWPSAAFALVVLAAAGAVAVPRRWHVLLTAIAVVVAAQILWLAAAADASPDAGTVVVAAALTLALVLVGIALQLVSGRREIDPGALSYVLAGFGGSIVLTLILFDERNERGVALLAAAGVWAALTAALAWRRQPDLGLAVGVAALGLSGAATGFLLTDSALVVAWAAESIVLASLARRFGDVRLQSLAAAYAVLATAWAFGREGDPELLFDSEADHLDGVLPLASVALAAGALRLLWPPELRPRTEAGLLSFLADVRRAVTRSADGLKEALVFVTAALATLAGAFALVAASFDHGHVAASVLGAVVGAVLLGRSARGQADAGVVVALAWLAAVLGEALAFDSSFFEESELGAVGGWSPIVAAAGLVAGTYVLRFLQPAREEWDVICGLAAAAGLLATGIGLADLTEDETFRGVGLVLAGAVYAVLGGFVLRRPGLRDYSTVLWALGLVALVGAERLLVHSDDLFVIAVAATGAGVGALAEPAREARLWFGGAAAAGLATVVTLGEVTPPSRFFSASEDPGWGTWSLAACALALAALAKLAPGRLERIVTGVTAGGVTMYGLSLVILEIAARVSTASVETDFERGHTAVSAVWALVGLALLVVGLLRGSAILRYGGLALFGLSLAKIFLYDLAELSSVARAFSFILVGALLLAGGFFLQRLSGRLGPGDGGPPD
jgi:uncharacterized membrane protein